MQPQNIHPTTLKYQVSDDVWTYIPCVMQYSGFDLAPGSDVTSYSVYSIQGDDAIEISGTFAPPPCVRKRLSRKRIRKVLMSIGIPRNIAEAQSRDMVQKLDMDFRKIEILAIVLTDLKFGVET